jgi:hypothetical protein
VREVDGGIRPFADGVKKRLVKQRYVSARHVQEKRADTVGEFKSAEICVSHMPSLKAKTLGKHAEEKYF